MKREDGNGVGDGVMISSDGIGVGDGVMISSDGIGVGSLCRIDMMFKACHQISIEQDVNDYEQQTGTLSLTVLEAVSQAMMGMGRALV